MLDAKTPPALPFTGERFTPEAQGKLWYEHWHRYAFALPLAKGRTVLDAACGEGYGSALLAQAARRVIGVDVSQRAVAHARERYRVCANIEYWVASCTELPLPDASVDLIVSFETIEHLETQERMLDEFRRVLSPQGWLLLSSPNRPVYSAEEGSDNEFHVRELDRGELDALLQPRFAARRWFGHRLMFQSLIWSEALPNEPAETLRLANGELQRRVAPAEPAYFLVLCGGEAAQVPSLPGLSSFGDGAGWLWEDYHSAYRQLRATQERCRELERRLAAQPLADFRKTQSLTVRQDVAPDRECLPRILHISHGLGGGVLRHLDDLSGLLADSVESVSLSATPGGALLSSPGRAPADYRLPADWEALITDLSACNIARVHYHHVHAWPAEVLGLAERLGLPYDLTVHDHWPYCPQYHLADPHGQYCGEPGPEGCALCLRERPAQWGMDIEQWRSAAARLVAQALRVFVPSRALARSLSRRFPGLAPVVVPHPERPRRKLGVVKIAVLGAMSNSKGLGVVRACAADAAKRGLPLHFRVIGFVGEPVPTWPELPLSLTGEYREADLDELLAFEKPEVFFFPAQVPESHCYTLSAALGQGRPIIASDCGAFPERLASVTGARLLPRDALPAAWNQALLEAAPLALGPNESTENVGAIDAGTAFYRGAYLDGLPETVASLRWPERAHRVVAAASEAPRLEDLFRFGVDAGQARMRAELRQRVAAADRIMREQHLQILALQAQLDPGEVPPSLTPLVPIIKTESAALPVVASQSHREGLQVLARSTRPRILFLSHAMGGGTEKHLQDLLAAIAPEVEALVMRPATLGVLRIDWQREQAAFTLHFPLPQKLAALRDWLVNAALSRVHLHHVAGFPPETLDLLGELKCPLDITLHDYFVVCPQYQLTDAGGSYCGEPDEAGCARCLAARPHPWGWTIEHWRARFRALLGQADRVFAPSRDLVHRLTKYVPTDRVGYAPHAEPVQAPVVPPLRVALLGKLSANKGLGVVEACARDAQARGLPLHFIVLGPTTSALPQWPELPIRVLGAYPEGQLDALIAIERPEVMFLPNQSPESYSYVLNAALRSGLPIVASDLGAIGERLASHSRATLLPWRSTAPTWNAALLAAARPAMEIRTPVRHGSLAMVAAQS